MKVEIKAYAKINLVLDVLKKRADGYHEVAMVMQAIDVADRITISPAVENKLTSNKKEVPTDERNLALKAAKLMQEHFSVVSPVEIYIEKNIPIEAGLAGGSTDGAATILGINQMFELGLSEQEMMELSAELGSDVPFCIGGPTALATGRGEKIELLPECPELWVVLVKPFFGVKTPMVYKHLDLSRVDQHPNVDRYIQGLQDKDEEMLLAEIGNVLEYSTFELYPKVKQLKEQLIQLGARHVLMSGSGPTIFCLFNNKDEAEQFYQVALKEENDVFLTKTVTDKMIKERVMKNDERASLDSR